MVLRDGSDEPVFDGVAEEFVRLIQLSYPGRLDIGMRMHAMTQTESYDLGAGRSYDFYKGQIYPQFFCFNTRVLMPQICASCVHTNTPVPFGITRPAGFFDVLKILPMDLETVIRLLRPHTDPTDDFFIEFDDPIEEAMDVRRIAQAIGVDQWRSQEETS